MNLFLDSENQNWTAVEGTHRKLHQQSRRMSWVLELAQTGRHLTGLPGAWRCTGRNNEEMVDKLVHMGVISSKEVEEAFRTVPRGAFVPPDLQLEAYIDSPLVGDPHVHMSAPHMYATVLEALDLSPGGKSCNQFCVCVSFCANWSFLHRLRQNHIIVSRLENGG